MWDILSRAQKHIQIEDATRSAVDRSFKGEDNGEKLKPQPAFPKKNQNRASDAINKPSSRNPAKTYEDEADFTPFKISEDHVFDAIKNQEWVRRPRPLPPNPKGPGAGEYCVFHDGMGHRTVDCRSSRRQLQELVNRGYLKKFILNS